jgi:hypothetical protein
MKDIQLIFIVTILFISCKEKSPIEIDEVPIVRIVYPFNGQIITGPIMLKAEVKQNRPIVFVDFICDSICIGRDSIFPYAYYWEAGFQADGKNHILFAKAIDDRGNIGESSKITVTIDTNATAISILYPTEGEILYGPYTITLDTIGLGNVCAVTFLIDNQILDIDSTKPFEQYWFVPFWADGNTHTMQAVAIDGFQRIGKSQIVSVIVSTSASIYPQIDRPNNNIFTETQPIHFVWHPVPTAINYTIEVSEFPDFNHINFSTTSVDTSVDWLSPQPSLFGWRIKALNKLGRSTAWSPSAEFSTIITFSKSYSSSGSEEIQSAAEISNGGYIVTTWTNYGIEFGGKIMKLDKMGNEIWERTLSVEPKKIIETADRGFVVVGNAIILKLNSQGIESWSRTYGNYRGQYFWDVLQKAEGSFLVAASIESKQRSGWLLALAPNGDTLWTRTYSANGDVDLYKLSQLNDGSLILAGNYRGWIDSAHFYPNVAWLMQTNQTGDSVWYKTYSHGSGAYLLSMAKGTNGFILAGSTNVSSSNFGRIWLAKTELNGDLIWSKDYGSTGQEGAADVIALVEGGYVVTGGYETSQWNTCDLYLMNLDENGNERWFKRYGNDGPDYSYTVSQVSDGGFLVGGYRTVINKGPEMWLIKTDRNGRIKYSD